MCALGLATCAAMRLGAAACLIVQANNLAASYTLFCLERRVLLPDWRCMKVIHCKTVGLLPASENASGAFRRRHQNSTWGSEIHNAFNTD